MAILDILKKKNEKPEDEKISEKKEEVSVSVKKPAKNKGKTEEIDAVKNNVEKVRQKTTNLQNILKYPRITEKAAILAERNAYTFEINFDANKIDVARAIKQIYNIEPIKINIIKLPARKVVVRGKRGVKSAVKKAMVYLKKGDKIEFV